MPPKAPPWHQVLSILPKLSMIDIYTGFKGECGETDDLYYLYLYMLFVILVTRGTFM